MLLLQYLPSIHVVVLTPKPLRLGLDTGLLAAGRGDSRSNGRRWAHFGRETSWPSVSCSLNQGGLFLQEAACMECAFLICRPCHSCASITMLCFVHMSAN